MFSYIVSICFYTFPCRFSYLFHIFPSISIFFLYVSKSFLYPYISLHHIFGWCLLFTLLLPSFAHKRRIVHKRRHLILKNIWELVALSRWFLVPFLAYFMVVFFLLNLLWITFSSSIFFSSSLSKGFGVPGGLHVFCGAFLHMPKLTTSIWWDPSFLFIILLILLLLETIILFLLQLFSIPPC